MTVVRAEEETIGGDGVLDEVEWVTFPANEWTLLATGFPVTGHWARTTTAGVWGQWAGDLWASLAGAGIASDSLPPQFNQQTRDCGV